MRKLKELPEEYKLIEFNKIISENEFSILKGGLLAINMEDKWIVSNDDNKIYIHRSWTKNCIYEFNIIEKDNIRLIEEIKVNNNPREYKFTNHSEEIELFEDILELFLNKKLSGKYENG